MFGSSTNFSVVMQNIILANLFFQIAFHPKFSSSRVEKERRAILSELQMMNTIEYRVDCQVSELFHIEKGYVLTAPENSC